LLVAFGPVIDGQPDQIVPCSWDRLLPPYNTELSKVDIKNGLIHLANPIKINNSTLIDFSYISLYFSVLFVIHPSLYFIIHSLILSQNYPICGTPFVPLRMKLEVTLLGA